MLLQAYTPDELKFAYCCHVYFRWHTRWRTPHAGLARITAESIEKQRMGRPRVRDEWKARVKFVDAEPL